MDLGNPSVNRCQEAEKLSRFWIPMPPPKARIFIELYLIGNPAQAIVAWKDVRHFADANDRIGSRSVGRSMARPLTVAQPTFADREGDSPRPWRNSSRHAGAIPSSACCATTERRPSLCPTT